MKSRKIIAALTLVALLVTVAGGVALAGGYKNSANASGTLEVSPGGGVSFQAQAELQVQAQAELQAGDSQVSVDLQGDLAVDGSASGELETPGVQPGVEPPEVEIPPVEPPQPPASDPGNGGDTQQCVRDKLDEGIQAGQECMAKWMELAGQMMEKFQKACEAYLQAGVSKYQNMDEATREKITALLQQLKDQAAKWEQLCQTWADTLNQAVQGGTGNIQLPGPGGADLTEQPQLPSAPAGFDLEIDGSARGEMQMGIDPTQPGLTGSSEMESELRGHLEMR